MPPTRVPRCGALVVVVAAPEPHVPRLRRGRVPASAIASGVRVVDVPASRELRPRTSSRVLAPPSGVRGARAPRAVCSSSECRAPAERAAPAPRAPRWPCARVECVAPSPSERRGGRARDERAVCSCRACRGWPWPCARVERAGVLASREPCSRPACRARRPSAVCSCRGSGRGVPASSVPRSWRTCRGARVDRAAVAAPVVRVPRLRRASGRARRPSAVVPSPRRWSGVLASHEPRSSARDEGAAAPPSRVPPSRRGGVLVSSERRARVDRAAVVCSRRACRRARRPRAALWRPRRACRRARAQSAAAVCLRRGSRRARAEGAAARALAPSADVPSTRERYAGAVGAVSEWWTCLRRACRTDR